MASTRTQRGAWSSGACLSLYLSHSNIHTHTHVLPCLLSSAVVVVVVVVVGGGGGGVDRRKPTQPPPQ